MNASDIAWAAGLFEGEGSFALRWNGTGYRAMLEMQISMTDLDVLQRFHTIANCGRLSERAMRPGKTHWKTQWVWRASGKKAKELALLLRPHLCQRRTDRLDAILEMIDHTEPRPRKCECCDQVFAPTRFDRERFCSDDCRDQAKYLRRRYGTTSRRAAVARGFRPTIHVAGCIPGMRPDRITLRDDE